MAVRVVDACGRDRDLGANRINEWLRRRCPAAVVRHLQDVDLRQARREELSVDLLLDIAHQQEAAIAHQAGQHHRHVVDPGPAIRRLVGDTTGPGPEDPEIDLVDPEAIAGGNRAAIRCVAGGQGRFPRAVAWTRPRHPDLQDRRDVISLQEQHQPGHVVFVRVREDHRVDAAVPRRDPTIKCHEEPVRVRATVHQEPAASRTFNEDRVSLSDVEDRDSGDPSRP